ncbi:MAG: helix-turn-helix transcriptional regulator [Chlorobia bacterium]|nr:helix-turn-helix transcriptional regulator [Fimbriimonadaceae bacterium]
MENTPNLEDLEGANTGSELANEAGYSVAQTYRRFRSATGASPMAMRRRLLMERAAWTLRWTGRAIGDIAMEAHFETSDGFSRAFRSAYGIGPRDWRKLGAEDYRIGGPGGVHFHPDGEARPVGKENQMNLYEQLMDDHRAETHRLIDLAFTLTDRNQPIKDVDPFPWCGQDLTVEQLVERCSTYAEPWLHALRQIKFGDKPETAAEHHARLEKNHEAWLKLHDEIIEDGAWNLTFVDADCNPPEVFAYGFVMKHALYFNTHQRISLAIQLRARGVDAGLGDQPARE